MKNGSFLAVLLGFLALAGCTPEIVAGNERGGELRHVSNVNLGEAFKVADDHCRKFGRVARVNDQDWVYNTQTFSCVAP